MGLRPDGSWSALLSEPLYMHAASAGAVGQAAMRRVLINAYPKPTPQRLPNSRTAICEISPDVQHLVALWVSGVRLFRVASTLCHSVCMPVRSSSGSSSPAEEVGAAYYHRLSTQTYQTTFDSSPAGLTDISYPEIQMLGRQRSRIVYHSPDLVVKDDPNTHQTIFRVASVFGSTDAV